MRNEGKYNYINKDKELQGDSNKKRADALFLLRVQKILLRAL